MKAPKALQTTAAGPRRCERSRISSNTSRPNIAAQPSDVARQFPRTQPPSQRPQSQPVTPALEEPLHYASAGLASAEKFETHNRAFANSLPLHSGIFQTGETGKRDPRAPYARRQTANFQHHPDRLGLSGSLRR
jgi:hypothetical protein